MKTQPNSNNPTAWAGYWRGTNGTDQTSICGPSFENRLSLDAMCMHGYNVVNSPYTTFWASDLHHRLFHTIKVGEGLVEHYADGYGPSLELAKETPEESVRNSHSLALFALDVYAFDVAAPNQGCTGEYVPEEEEGESSEASSTTESATSVEASTTAAAATTEAAATESASAESAVEATTTTEEPASTTESADDVSS